MAAALLRRALASHGYHARVESAGVVGHDDAAAEPEARDACATLGLDLSEHRARSLGDDLAHAARLLLAIDSGTLAVLRARHGPCVPAASLGQLAGSSRDVPDPFRMQVGAWITYAREIEALLVAALPQIVARAGLVTTAEPTQIVEVAGLAAEPPSATGAAAERLLAALAEFPELIDWGRARERLQREFATGQQGDAGRAYSMLLLALLSMTPTPPTPGQLALLRSGAARLATGPGQQDIADLSAQIASWSSR